MNAKGGAKQKLVGALRAGLRSVGKSSTGRRFIGRAARELEIASRPEPARVPVSASKSDGDGLSLNRLCGPDAWDDPVWMMYNRALGLSGRLHRKDFEWTHAIYGLERIDALHPSSRVLGVGAGREDVLFYLANRCAQIVATDLYEGVFADWEAVPDFLEDTTKYAPFPFRTDGLVAMRADGRVLPFDDETFDVAYSLGSIEHFGGHHAAAESMREQARVIRRGGVVCVATEWILKGGPHFEYFTPDELQEFIIDASGLELIGELDPTPPPQQFIDDPVRLDGDISRLPHLVVGLEDITWTSVVLFLRKG